MAKFFLKRRLFIKEAAQYLVIGDSNNALYVMNNSDNIAVLNSLTSDGVLFEEGKGNELFDGLSNNTWLCEQYPVIDRTESFFESLGTDFPRAAKEFPILILGAGGVGGTISYMLSQFGFHNLHILDYDLVEESDCVKTMVYRNCDIGAYKVDALKRIISENFKIEIKTCKTKIADIDNMRSIVYDIKPTLIINAIDPNPVHKLNLNLVSFETGIPFIPVSYSYEWMTIGPFIIPGKTYCYHSMRTMQLSGTEGTFDISNVKNIHTNYSIHPSISFVINSLASLTIKEILFFFAGRLDLVLSYNNYVVVSILSMDGTSTEMMCSTDCLICKGVIETV